MDGFVRSEARESGHTDSSSRDVVTPRGQPGGAGGKTMLKASSNGSSSDLHTIGNSKMIQGGDFTERCQLLAGQAGKADRGAAVANFITSSKTDAATPLTAGLAAALASEYPECYDYVRDKLQALLEACTDAPNISNFNKMWNWLRRRNSSMPQQFAQHLAEAVSILQKVNPSLLCLLTWLEQRPQIMLRAKVSSRPYILFNLRNKSAIPTQVGGAARPGLRLQAVRGASMWQLQSAQAQIELLQWRLGCALMESVEKDTDLRMLKNTIEDKDDVLGAFASTFKYNRKVHTVINTTMNAASRSIGTLATDLRTMNKQNMQLKAGLAAFKANRFKVPLNEVHAGIEADMTKLQQKLDREATEKAELKRLNSQLNTKVQAYQRSQDLFVGAQEIRNNRDKLQRHVYELESDIQRLLHQLEAANKKASAAVDAKKEAVRSAETANRNHKDAMGRIQELKAAATAWGVQKTAMQQEIDTLRANCATLQERLLAVRAVDVLDLILENQRLQVALQDSKAQVHKEHTDCCTARNKLQTVTHISNDQASRLQKVEATLVAERKLLAKEQLATVAALKAQAELELQIKQLKDQLTKAKGGSSEAGAKKRG